MRTLLAMAVSPPSLSCYGKITHPFPSVAIDSSSLVITYPDVDVQDEIHLASLFGQPSHGRISHPEDLGYFATESQNETASGASDSPNNINFRVKLQNFSKGFVFSPLDILASRDLLTSYSSLSRD